VTKKENAVRGFAAACLVLFGMAIALATLGRAADKSPSLSETEDFLTNHGNTVGMVTTKNVDGTMMMMHQVTFSAKACVATTTLSITSPTVPEMPPNTATKSMRRGQLSDDVQVFQSSPGIELSPGYKVTLGYASAPQLGLTVGYYDAGEAERITRALEHWLRICGKSKKEPF
jgi:hypothetical protein